jgi:SAM-dependent methyltransferase
MPFTAERLQRLADIERWHFWFVGRRRLIDRLVGRYLPGPPATLLDAGCGTGATLEWLAARGYRVTGCDQRPEGLGQVRAVSAGVFQADVTRLPVPGQQFDAAFSLDVIEHVDDRAAIGELVRVLKPGAHLVVSVPAMPSLWSYRDEAAGHRRRYTRAGLLTLLRSFHLDVQYVGYYQCLLLPLVMATRWLGSRNPVWRDREDLPHPVINAALTFVARLDARLGRVVGWPCGSSLVAVCRAPAGSPEAE